jgi:hypothetical protein
MDGVSLSVATTSDRVRCYGPAFASRVRDVVEMLAEPAQDVSHLAVSKNHYYTQCNFKAALDGVISEVTRVVAALEAVTGHHVKDSTPAKYSLSLRETCYLACLQISGEDNKSCSNVCRLIRSSLTKSMVTCRHLGTLDRSGRHLTLPIRKYRP